MNKKYNTFYDKKLLPYNIDLLFDIVLDIEKYPEFLPWCEKVAIVHKKNNKIIANTTINFKKITVTYKSEITWNEEKKSITVISQHGAFKHLYTLWEFVPLENQTVVKFYIEFQFKYRFLDHLLGLFYKKAQKKVINAFSLRANQKNYNSNNNLK